MSQPAERLMDTWLTHMLSRPRSGAVTDSQNRARAPHASNFRLERSSLFSGFADTAWADFHQRPFSEIGYSAKLKLFFLIPPCERKKKKVKIKNRKRNGGCKVRSILL